MRAEAVALALLVLAPIALAQAPSARWTQAGGDMGRTSAALLSDQTLDIARAFRFLEPGETIFSAGPAGLVETSEGAAAMVGGESCRLVAIDPRAGRARQVGERIACVPVALVGRSTLALAAIPERNAVLVGVSSGPEADPLRLLSLGDGSVLWTATPPRTPGDDSTYRIIDASVDEAADLAIVPVLSSDGSPRSPLMAVRLSTGEVLWSRPVSTLSRDLVPPPIELDAPTSEFQPVRAALMPNGILVNGIFGRGGQATNPPGYAWLDREGVGVGAEAFGLDSFNAPGARGLPTRAFSEWGATWGDRGAFVALGNLVLIDAESATPRHVPLDSPASTEALELAPPAWWQDKLLVPGEERLFAVSSTDGTPLWETPWTAPRGAFLLQVIIVPPGTAYVATSVTLSSRNELTLHRLDLDTGEEIQRLPLPLDVAPAQGVFDGTLLPLLATDELLVWTDDGQAVVLSRAAEPPVVDVSDEYPAISAPVVVTLRETRGDIVNASIAWGDGEIEAAASNVQHSHQYDEGRRRVLRVTAFYADDTSSTFERVIYVGETRPRELTAIQRAFEPEYQNYTLFVLGLVATGGGALFAALLRRQRHSRLAEEEAKLRKVIDASLLNPTTGLAALEGHRAHLRDQHTRRRLDDAQYQLLDSRAVRAMKSARYRLLGASLNKLTPHFRRILDTALEDGQVTTGEMAALVQALDEERALSDAEREKMRALLAGWAR